MEPISFASFTFAGLLSTFPVQGEQVSQAVITTQISPAIAGQWEIELDNEQTSDTLITNTQQNDKTRVESAMTTTALVEQNERRIVVKNPTTQLSTNASEINVSAIKVPQCREVYNFGADNQMWAVSGKEWTYGRYIVTHLEEGLPIIALQTIYDNNEKDCSGNQIDQSNEAFIAFLKHDNNRMQWCADSSGEECFMSFNKVLP